MTQVLNAKGGFRRFCWFVGHLFAFKRYSGGRTTSICNCSSLFSNVLRPDNRLNRPIVIPSNPRARIAGRTNCRSYLVYNWRKISGFLLLMKPHSMQNLYAVDITDVYIALRIISASSDLSGAATALRGVKLSEYEKALKTSI